MADVPALLALRGAAVTFGGRPLFTGIDIRLAPGEKACLVGRNGCGKSTLLKLLAGRIEPDGGERFLQPGCRVAYLPQDPAPVPGATVASHIAADLPETDLPGTPAMPRPDAATAAADHRVAALLDRLQLAGGTAMAELSGGESRRADLARVLAAEPDVLLLDEPTNHLDIATIGWLEGLITRHRGAVLTISHDRALLDATSARTYWMDRGVLRSNDAGFNRFEAWSAAVYEEEEKAAQRLDTRLRAEARWLQRGVTARRKRNQGRLRRLQEMRRTRAGMMQRTGSAALAASAADRSGRLVIEADGITKRWGDAAPVVADFSTRVLRGDRVGLIGANGAGKTTLLRLLTGDLAPDAGRVRLGTALEIAYFDQRRAQLNPKDTPWQTLCPRGGDQVMVGDRPRHVVSYLRDFLFDDRQASAPVESLSGGERNRLLLALILARPSNLLVLDEPTNDLDMETLDLLEDMLGDYAGTVLLVSHDRDFLDRVVTSTLVLEGGGRVSDHPGGYSDCVRQRGAVPGTSAEAGNKLAGNKPGGGKPGGGKAKGSRATASAADTARPGKLSYNDQRELDGLPARIDALGEEIATLQQTLADPGLYGRDPTAFRAATDRLGTAEAALAAAEDRWLALETRREGG